MNNPADLDIDGLKRLWQEAFGDTDAFLAHFYEAAYSPERCRCVKLHGEVAAALYWFDCEAYGKPYAYVYAVATAKRYRGRGLCRKLMAQTHEDMEKMGYHGAILVPADAGLQKMYAAMGYEAFSGTEMLRCSAAEMAAGIKEIDAQRYATLRRDYLQDGDVRQEGKNLTFLSGFSRFYEGADFLLTADLRDGCVYGAELLGCTEKAEEIVKALGCVRGEFRVRGKDIFAMCRLMNGGRMPTYFALAFD